MYICISFFLLIHVFCSLGSFFLLLIWVIFILKYLEKYKKAWQGVLIKFSPAFTSTLPGFVDCYSKTSYVLNTSTYFISATTMLVPFSFPNKQCYFPSSGLCIHVPSAQNALPQLSAWLVCVLQAPAWNAWPWRALPRLSVLKKGLYSFLYSFFQKSLPIIHSTYHHL